MTINYNDAEFNRLDFTAELNRGNDNDDLRNDITGNELVIDDMNRKADMVMPMSYSAVATDDPNRTDVTGYDRNNVSGGKFLCSFEGEDSAQRARKYVNELNTNTQPDDTSLRAKLTSIVTDMFDDKLTIHGAILATLAAGGYAQSQEFQSLISEYELYSEKHDEPPFALSASFGELARSNGLAELYGWLDFFFRYRNDDANPELVAEAIRLKLSGMD